MPSEFDPFGDFATAGYLRNVAAEKDLGLVKRVEHQLFRAQLSKALDYLKGCKRIEYSDFLQVHHILFGGLYPWAGKDRAQISPDRAVIKGTVYFCHPQSCRLAVEEGLSLAQERKRIAKQPGLIMGMFAYGHPFLDGNGRTMLLVHSELCFRADMSVDWLRTKKAPYLQALTKELEDPNAGHLDDYLRPFIGKRIPRDQWHKSVSDLPGLDGATPTSEISTQYADPEVAQGYRDFERRRGYKLK